jgi:hypothetical protein
MFLCASIARQKLPCIIYNRANDRATESSRIKGPPRPLQDRLKWGSKLDADSHSYEPIAIWLGRGPERQGAPGIGLLFWRLDDRFEASNAWQTQIPSQA